MGEDTIIIIKKCLHSAYPQVEVTQLNAENPEIRFRFVLMGVQITKLKS